MKFINIRELSTGTSLLIYKLRDCLGTLFRNSLTVGSLKKINNLFIKDIFHGYCLKRQSLSQRVFSYDD